MAVRRYQSGRRHSRCFSIDNSRADCTSWLRAQYYNLGRQQVRRFPPASRLRILFTPATWQRFGFANGTFADVFGRREEDGSSFVVAWRASSTRSVTLGCAQHYDVLRWHSAVYFTDAVYGNPELLMLPVVKKYWRNAPRWGGGGGLICIRASYPSF